MWGEGEGEDVTQTVLGLSARWIWHLEEQRPLTLRCGRAAVSLCKRTYVCAHLVRTYIHISRVNAKAYACYSHSFARSCSQAGRSDTPARAHTSGVDRVQLPIV